MPSNDEWWLGTEAGPVVRPDALTRVRTRHAGETWDVVATVMVTRAPVTDRAARSSEHLKVLRLASTPTTVADIASDADLPLGVVRILLADLRELGLIAVRSQVSITERIDQHTLREVLNGLRGLLCRWSEGGAWRPRPICGWANGRTCCGALVPLSGRWQSGRFCWTRT